MTQKFHQRFNLAVETDEAKRRFVNRSHNSISEIIKKASKEHGRGSEVERFVCTKLGERWAGSGCLPGILGDNFIEHVRALEALHQHGLTRQVADSAIKEILIESEIDLGIRWEKGMFVPTGASLLDDALVNDVLKSIAGEENVLVPFRKGLTHFLQSVNKPELLSDVITDMYEALEAQAKITTGKDKDLSANAELFIASLALSNEYKPLMKSYISYANEFRHAADRGQKKSTPTRKETESFLYLTGLILRLATSV